MNETLEAPLFHTPQQTISVGSLDDAVHAVDDPYSDRLRCDHPQTDHPEALGDALIETAEQLGRGRVVIFAEASNVSSFEDAGYTLEGVMPGFYKGEEDCAVLGCAIGAPTLELADAAAIEATNQILARAQNERRAPRPSIETTRARVNEAREIAELLDETFRAYPTPSHDPAYVARLIEEGTPFRIVREDKEIIACASADLVREAKTAELTDCATRPEHRGRGLMQSILQDLMEDLRKMGYPTAFTLARARIPGVNLAFKRLGFELRGHMARSCRIGTRLEDMSIWSRHL